MTLVEAAPLDDMRLILCLESDRRAPFDGVAKPDHKLTGRAPAQFLELGASPAVTRESPRRRPISTAPVRDPRSVAAATPVIAKEWVRWEMHISG